MSGRFGIFDCSIDLLCSIDSIGVRTDLVEEGKGLGGSGIAEKSVELGSAGREFSLNEQLDEADV